MTIKLKPCPFCGALPDAHQWRTEGRVVCHNCVYANGTRSHFAAVSAPTLQEAAEIWNTRIRAEQCYRCKYAEYNEYNELLLCNYWCAEVDDDYFCGDFKEKDDDTKNI